MAPVSTLSLLEQLTQVLQRDLIEHCASPYRFMTMATEEGQRFAIAMLRSRWVGKPISMPDGKTVTVDDIRRGTGSTETFIELVVKIGSPARYTVMVEFVEQIPQELLAKPPPPKKTRQRGHPTEPEDEDERGEGADA